MVLQANEVKGHGKTKALVETLSIEVNKLEKETQRLTKVIIELEEQRFSSCQSSLCRLTQDLEASQGELESLRVEWGRTALAQDKLIATKQTLTNQVAQLKLQNNDLEKS